jgi:hypothetical protein
MNIKKLKYCTRDMSLQRLGLPLVVLQAFDTQGMAGQGHCHLWLASTETAQVFLLVRVKKRQKSCRSYVTPC